MINYLLKKNKNHGFTLIELIIVVAIIALIAAISFVALNPSKRIGEAADSTRFLDVDAIKAAIERVTVDSGAVPSALSSLAENTPYMIVMSGESTSGEINCENLNGTIAKADILGAISASLPKVPLDPDLPDNSTTTGYFLYKKNNNFFVSYCDSYSEYPFTCGLSMAKDLEDNSYLTVQIGNQCWMKESLNLGTRINGASEQTNNAVTEKYCYSDNDSLCTSRGGLYQWNEMMQYGASCNGTGEPPNDKCASPVQGLCPSGWHIPSHYELVTLTRAVCTSATCVTDFPYDTTTLVPIGTDEGTKLKVGGSSGFEAILTGYRRPSADFAGSSAGGRVWSSTQYDVNDGLRLGLSTLSTVFPDNAEKTYGYSVRCVKD